MHTYIHKLDRTQQCRLPCCNVGLRALRRFRFLMKMLQQTSVKIHLFALTVSNSSPVVRMIPPLPPTDDGGVVVMM
jgi:hypothetical protein